MSVKKVIYFNAPGKAEVIRLLLSSQNEKFEDERLTFEQWAPMKPKTKYGQLPLLKLENGVEMNESSAIIRYLARKAKLYGKDEWEMYLIDRALDTMGDLALRAALVRYEKCDKKKEELCKELKETHTPFYLGNLTKYIEDGKGEFMVGSSPTLADIALIALLDHFKDARPHFPKLDNIYNKTIAAFPGIKKYMDTRPKIE